MDLLRDSKTRLIVIVAALGAALVIAVASCGGGGGDDDAGEEVSDTSGGARNGDNADSGETEGSSSGDAAGGDEDAQVLAEVTGEEDITLTITRAERQSGGFLTVEGTLHNGGNDTWRSGSWSGDEEELAQNPFSMAGASLIARDEGKRYLILRDTEGRCLCTVFTTEIDAGETVSWFAQFPEPEASTKEVDFQIGRMPPATIEIQ